VRFKSPDFARHPTEAWAVANLEVEIGPIEKTGNATVDERNQLVMDAFNLGSGNLLTPRHVLTWNVWFRLLRTLFGMSRSPAGSQSSRPIARSRLHPHVAGP
jgi:hypothetical protein